ncbi:MAG TPA: hypothetical protein PLX85_01100, partial [Dehalococcoidia bacterium]|nr:hypothetical protein [Dehalococcoidia bacterium]
ATILSHAGLDPTVVIGGTLFLLDKTYAGGELHGIGGPKLAAPQATLLMDPMPYRRLVRRAGWSFEDYVAWVAAFEERPEHESLRNRGRHVFERVHSDVRAPLEERFLDRTDEDAAPAEDAQGCAAVRVALGAHLDELDLDRRVGRTQGGSDQLALGERESGAARREPEVGQLSSRFSRSPGSSSSRKSFRTASM